MAAQGQLEDMTLFISSRGYADVAHHALQVRDHVGIIFSTDMPMVLRSVAGQSGTYKLIGAAFIHSLVDGEIPEFDNIKKELKLPLEERNGICIV
jgi:hypothetical protein